MTDIQPQDTPPEQTSVSSNSGIFIAPQSTPVKRSNRNLFVVSGVLLVGVCLCVGVCGIIFGTGMFKVITERPKIERVIDEFMSVMADQNATQAYALFSTRSKRNTTLADVEKLLTGNNYILFEGYRGVTVTNLNLTAAFNTDPDLPQGTVAKVEGTISYAGGFTGTFNAILEQEGDTWQLFGININVPPDKFSP